MSLLALVLPFVVGWLVVAVAWPRDAHAQTLPLRAVLAVGFGLGSASLSAFVLLPVRDDVAPLEAALLEGALAAALAGWLWRRRATSPPTPIAPAPRTSWLAGLGVVLAAVGAGLVFVLATRRDPHGVTDALSFWNLRAHMLAGSGVHWRQAFAAELPHADYPLLVPLAAVRAWCGLGGTSPFVPAAIAALFTLGTTALLWAGVRAVGGSGLVAAAAMLGCPYFTVIGASQLADVPLAFFALAAVVLLALHTHTTSSGRSLLALAGLALGFAAWTKNEGALLLVVVPTVWSLRADGRSLRERALDLLALVLGASPVLLALATFKLWLAPTNDLVAEVAGGGLLARIQDGERWLAIAGGVLRWSWNAGPVMVPCVALYWLLAGRRVTFPLTASCVLLVLFCGVYLVASADLEWHLGTSMPRLVLQILPMALFGVFLPASPRPAER